MTGHIQWTTSLPKGWSRRSTPVICRTTLSTLRAFARLVPRWTFGHRDFVSKTGGPTLRGHRVFVNSVKWGGTLQNHWVDKITLQCRSNGSEQCCAWTTIGSRSFRYAEIQVSSRISDKENSLTIRLARASNHTAYSSGIATYPSRTERMPLWDLAPMDQGLRPNSQEMPNAEDVVSAN